MNHLKATFFLGILFLATIGCDKNDELELCSADWKSELSVELNAISEAGTNYVLDPAIHNCTTLTKAYQAYVNAMEAYNNCNELKDQNRVDWEKALKDAKNSLDMAC